MWENYHHAEHHRALKLKTAAALGLNMMKYRERSAMRERQSGVHYNKEDGLLTLATN